MRRIALTALLAVTASLAVSSAQADSMRALPFTDLQPADGLTLVADSYPYATDAEMFDYVINTPFTPKPVHLVIEVSTQNIPGQDGTLADDFQQDFTLARPSDAYPTLYKVRTSTADKWLSTPGTYYWQAYSTVYDFSTGCEPCHYATPTRTVTVVPKPAVPAPPTIPKPAPPLPTPTPTPAANTNPPTTKVYVLPLDVGARRAKAYAVSHYHARKPTALCHRKYRATISCSVRWRSKGKRKSVAVEVTYGRDGYWVQKTF